MEGDGIQGGKNTKRPFAPAITKGATATETVDERNMSYLLTVSPSRSVLLRDQQWADEEETLGNGE